MRENNEQSGNTEQLKEDCKHQYPRSMENKIRVCGLCGHAEEASEISTEPLEPSQDELWNDIDNNYIRWNDHGKM